LRSDRIEKKYLADKRRKYYGGTKKSIYTFFDRLSSYVLFGKFIREKQGHF